MTARARDVVVVGLGGMGSAALYHLAGRGLRVLGLEQHGLGHRLGSSHGETRVIRKAYSEDPRYVPLLERSYELWRELEEDRAETLLWITGALHLGADGDPGIAGVRAAVAEHELAHEVLDGDEIRRRYPGLAPGDGDVGILEPDGGFLAVERCVLGHVEGAMRRGAEVRAFSPVQAIEPDGDGLAVRTGEARILTSAVVLCAGGGSAPGSPLALDLPLEIERQVQCWLAPLEPELFDVGRFPVFVRNAGADTFYGLPRHRHPGVKICRHHGRPPTSLAEIDRTPSRADLDDVGAFATAHVPRAAGPVLDARVCHYTNTPDHHFAIGAHPTLENAWIAAGFSGHGFKMSSVVGEILADLVISGRTACDIELFTPERFARNVNAG